MIAHQQGIDLRTRNAAPRTVACSVLYGTTQYLTAGKYGFTPTAYPAWGYPLEAPGVWRNYTIGRLTTGYLTAAPPMITKTKQRQIRSDQIRSAELTH